jgi:hypothetical protein
LGTSAGIAFFMLLAHRTGNAATVAVARIVVIADFLFTATAVVAQPITASRSLGTSAIRSGLDRVINPPLHHDRSFLAEGEMHDQASVAANRFRPVIASYSSSGSSSVSPPSARSRRFSGS